ncbi:tail fiber assembly protein [Citrobacter freundii]|uniref:tail fiber assembly protein n=1 Tax=Citrobacter freundii TaxID=546 RepID=UPI0034D396BF
MMNNYIYSPQNNAFYPLSLQEVYEQAGSWPADGMEISDDVYEEFLQSPPGKIRIAGEDGLPVWSEPTPPTHEELIAAAEAQRAELLASADRITADWRTELMLGDISDDDKKSLSEWMTYKRDVKAVPVETAIATGFKWPSLPA